MNAAFICNQNQARSQILSAAFSKLAPSHIFQSFGIIAREKTPLPVVIDSVFKEWGLESDGRFARNMGIHWDEILDFNVVLAVTTFIAEEVTNLGFTGRIVDLELEARLLGIDVMDPQLMPRRQCAFELAKYLVVAHSALQNLNFIPIPQKFKALIPDRESSTKSALEFAISSSGDDSVIVYADLVAPKVDLATKYFQSASKYRLNESRFEVAESPNGMPPRILIPANSVFWPSRTYLSSAWRNFLGQITAGEIVVITPPLENKSGKVPESYLATLGASEIHVVK